MESVKGIREKSKGIVVMVNVDGTYLLPEIMDKLRKGGITIKAVNLKKPSMDDVFVHYTGREIRDTGAEKAVHLKGRRALIDAYRISHYLLAGHAKICPVPNPPVCLACPACSVASLLWSCNVK